MLLTSLERNARLHSVLQILCESYEIGNFTAFLPLLAEDCVYTSMWVLSPLCGYAAVSNHLLGKGQAIRRSNAYPRCQIHELVGKTDPDSNAEIPLGDQAVPGTFALMYETGKLCLMMEQDTEGQTNQVLLDLDLTEDGHVRRINLCMPELFLTQRFCPYVAAVPCAGDDKFPDGKIIISNAYYHELRLFFDMADKILDSYCPCVIPFGVWEQILGYWVLFLQAPDYDSFLEEHLGFNYATWAVGKKRILYCLADAGASIWQSRAEHAAMQKALWEWSEKYRDQCSGIYLYGVRG